VANTGISAVIDPVGRIVDSLPLNTAGYLDVALPARAAPTLYARSGDGPVFWLVIVLILALVALQMQHGMRK
jgi:Apolipoprotein N-acyltransferase